MMYKYTRPMLKVPFCKMSGPVTWNILPMILGCTEVESCASVLMSFNATSPFALRHSPMIPTTS